MMEQLKNRNVRVIHTLSLLDIALKKFGELSTDHYVYSELRDALIHRFEHSFDTFWKLLKEYIEVKHGIVVASPKGVLKAAVDVNLVSDQEYKDLIKMVDDRNMTSHAYDKLLAEEIGQVIPCHYALMKTVHGRLV